MPCGRSVGESERDDAVFEEPFVATKGGLPLVSRGNAKQAESGLEVKLCEKLATFDTIQELVDEREWITILLGDGVEAAIVDAKSKRAIGLFDKEDG